MKSMNLHASGSPDGAGLPDGGSAARLFESYYDELHRLARGAMRHERRDHTLQATALLNEAYLRLAASETHPWNSRAQFCCAAAETMRRILIDHARSKAAEKRGSAARRVALDENPSDCPLPPGDVLAVHEALIHLEADDPRKGAIVKLHFFGGLSYGEIAHVLGVSVITVKRDWRYARAWMNARIGGAASICDDC